MGDTCHHDMKSDPNVDSRLCVTMTGPCRLISEQMVQQVGTWTMGEAVVRRGRGNSGLSVPFPQFCCGFKTALKAVLIFKNVGTTIVHLWEVFWWNFILKKCGIPQIILEKVPCRPKMEKQKVVSQSHLLSPLKVPVCVGLGAAGIKDQRHWDPSQWICPLSVAGTYLATRCHCTNHLGNSSARFCQELSLGHCLGDL